MSEILGILTNKASDNLQLSLQDEVAKFTAKASEINQKIEQTTTGIWSFASDSSFYNQPEKFTVLFNGNFYNALQIREELKKEGIQFEQENNAETILRAYLHWGDSFIEKIIGDFNIVIQDIKAQKIRIYRDAIGIKSLFYTFQDEVLIFATDLNQLISFVKQDLTWNETAIQYFFRAGYIPAPYSIYQGVYKIQAGTVVEFEKSSQSNVSFWSVGKKVEKHTLKVEKEAKNQLSQLIQESVQNRLSKDQSTGVLLSGGIDSSTVAAVAQSLSTNQIKTFSIGFKEAKFNESHFAKEIAQKIGTEHHELILSEKEAQDLIPNLPQWYGEPYGDASSIPSFIVTQLAAKYVNIALSGDGGDEQFMGYGMYTWANRLNKYKNLRFFIKTGLTLSPKVNHKRASPYFDFSSSTHLPSHIFSVDQGFYTEKQTKKYFNFSTSQVSFHQEVFQRNLSVVEEQSFFDLAYYLPGDLTVKVDRVARQNNLNLRAPLLDQQIVEWSLNLNEQLKLNNGEAKYLLKQVLFDYLPKSMFDRPKWGFGIPVAKWLKSELRPLLDKYVNPTVLQQFSFYNSDEIMRLKQEFLNGKDYLFNKLWLVIVFNMWAESRS